MRPRSDWSFIAGLLAMTLSVTVFMLVSGGTSGPRSLVSLPSSLVAAYDSLVDAGVLVHRVVEVPHQAGSLAVSVAAACAWTEGAETYWRYRSVLFEAQRSVASTYPVLPELVRLARYADADSSRLGRCLDERGEDFTARFAKGLQVVRGLRK